MDKAHTSCSVVITRAQKAKNMLEEMPFYHAELDQSPVNLRKTKAQKRREKFLGSATKKFDIFKEPSHFIDFKIPSDIAALQSVDPKSRFWFDKVSEVEGTS